MSTSIILFDGVCNLCNSAVNFILKYDPHGHFIFGSLQSASGGQLRDSYHIPAAVDSLILIEENKVYLHSEAALRIARRLVGLWPFLYVLIIVPEPIRDGLYKLIARNRYRWFGKRDVCSIPRPEVKSRFL